MNKITEYGARGAEYLEEYTRPQVQPIDLELHKHTEVIKKLSKVKLEEDTSDGTKRSINTYALPLSNPRVFSLLHSFAKYQPLVYVSQNGQPASMGIMSPNYDDHGHNRNPDIKVIPLFTPYPLVQKSQFDIVPDVRMMTMLAGAASSESAGVGGHTDVDKDLEHRATILGAISIDNSSFAISHANHGVRKSNGSVVSDLSNGKLGNIFAPNQSENDFTGFGTPIVIKPDQSTSKDYIYIPESFLENEGAYGVTFDDADRIMLGAGLQVLYSRNPQNENGRSFVGQQIKTIVEQVRSGGH